jgi:N-ethylmaleimide reductase
VGDLTPARANRGIADGEIDLAAFGRPLIANPDFVGRLREGTALRDYDPVMLDTLL